MSTVSFTQFLPHVVMYVRDVPDVVALQAIRNATIEFCEKTRAWQYELDPTPLLANIAEYEMDTPTDTIFVDLIECWAGTTLLIPKAIEELTRVYRMTDWRTLQGQPYYVTRTTPEVLTLVPKPASSVTGNLRVFAALAPTRNAAACDAQLYNRYVEYISYGARARLYDTPNAPYYDPKAAQIYLKRFNDACADVRTRVNKGMTRASPRIEFQRFV